ISQMAEDKAVDLYVLERAFISTHPNSELLFASVLEAYEAENPEVASAVLKRLEDVRQRGLLKMAISGEEQVPSVNAASSFMLQYGQFEATHKQQLESLGLPKHLWQVLYKKLASEILDIGEYVVLNSVEDSTKHTAYLTEHKLCLSQDKLDAQSNVFLIDHAWTTTIDQALGQLDSAPGLLERMETLTGIFEPHEKMPIMPNTESLDAANEVNVPVVVAQTG
ncbi:hypothetical protein LPJ57_011458, partial [Coemansia sp. RSA 486]